MEYLWANLKDVELANLPTTTLAEGSPTPPNRASNGSARARRLVVGFLAHTGLSLDP